MELNPVDPFTPPADIELRPSPVAADGAPIRIRPGWIDALGSAARPQPAADRFWTAQARTPLIGKQVAVDGVDLVEVSFLARVDTDREVMVCLTSLTDNHRANIEPALLQPICGGPVRQVSYLLPADGRYSYQLVYRDHFPLQVGADRPGWVRVRQDGRPDPRNPALLTRPHTGPASVFRGPGTPRHPTAQHFEPVDGVVDPRGPAGRELLVEHSDGRSRRATLLTGADPGAPLLILLDGEAWRPWNLSALRTGRRRPTLVLMDSVDLQRRAAELPIPDRCARIITDLLAAVRRTGLVTVDPDRTTIAGQSFGGLAAAGLVIDRPDLATSAIVQSGSFWFDRDVSSAPGATAPGHLTRSLAGRTLGHRPRLAVQVGTDEAEMTTQARQFRDAARAAGAAVSYTEFRGGHDYAWWREELATGMRQLGI
ncbi:enterochelin esterase domain-containing protein [Nakamurella lactea]|uniref:enterochelin esterase domain-containing protein n=1 Tax=Nakamurella lactea TaxID=459515 RepID=UPI00041FA808|nr:alpha/beta hydrolase-fold protein [Nakamurella lactea]